MEYEKSVSSSVDHGDCQILRRQVVLETRILKEPDEKDEGLHLHVGMNAHVVAEPVDGRILPAYTITGSGGGGTHVYHWKEFRALTNRERARLQTFPDDFVFRGSKESVRKQIGMAVPCDGAQVILEALLKTFEGEAYESVTPSVGIFPAKTFDPDA